MELAEVDLFVEEGLEGWCDVIAVVVDVIVGFGVLFVVPVVVMVVRHGLDWWGRMDGGVAFGSSGVAPS